MVFSQIDIYAFLTKKIEKCQQEIIRYQEHVQNLTDEINRVHGLREGAVQDAVAAKDAEIASLKVRLSAKRQHDSLIDPVPFFSETNQISS